MSARAVFEACLKQMRNIVPEAAGCGNWRTKSRVQMQTLCASVFGALADDDERRERFLHAEARLSSSSMLVKDVQAYRGLMDEVIFYQRARHEIMQTMPGDKPRREFERTVRDLKEEGASSAGAIDIFRAAGYAKSDLSLLDDDLLKTFGSRSITNLQLKLLKKLLEDEISRCRAQNSPKAAALESVLEAAFQQYADKSIDSRAVVDALVRIRRDVAAVEHAGNP